MSTEPVPTEATSDNVPERRVADEHRDAQAARKQERRGLLFWLAFLTFAILNFGMRIVVHTADQLTTGEHSDWSIFWSFWGVMIVPFGIWMYSKQLRDLTLSAQRLALVEAAALKEAAKTAADK